MQFVLGLLSAACVFLAIALVFVLNRSNDIKFRFRKIEDKIETMYGKILTLPAPVQNTIHLGFKNPSVEMGLGPVNISIKPEDFKLKANRLREIFIRNLATRPHPDPSTCAYMILDRAGLVQILSGEPWKQTKEALTRLLVNDDEKATERFLVTLADSVAAAS